MVSGVRDRNGKVTSVDKRTHTSPVSRRHFLKGAAGVSAAVLAGSAGRNVAFAAGSDKMCIALIGCGGRGTADARNCLRSAPGVELVAMADLFKDRLDSSLAQLKGGGGKKKPKKSISLAGKVKVAPDRRFVGFDAYEKVMALPDVNYVLLTTPPGFRADMFKAAIEAGKNVFMEKPVAVDPVGVRMILDASEQAKAKNLGVLPGTQLRHWKIFQETVKRIHGGAIGKLVGGQCYYNTGTLWYRTPGRGKTWTAAEEQIRNWLYYTWLSGDHIAEQHVHNLDVMNWCFGGPPVKAMGTGGRQVRVEAKWGNIWDHFTVEFEYAGGVRTMSMCRQTAGATRRVTDYIVGTKGRACPRKGEIWDEDGQTTWKFAGRQTDPSIQEHTDLIESIRAGKPLNEGKRIAETTLTAILGRMSAYTGREMNFAWALKSSKLDLRHKGLRFGPLPVRPVAMPGQTKLI